MEYIASMINLNNTLFKKYNKGPVISSWGQFLDACYETAAESKNYVRASKINDLIYLNTIEPGPNTDKQIKEHLNY